MHNKASQNRQQAGWTRYTRLCWQALCAIRDILYFKRFGNLPLGLVLE